MAHTAPASHQSAWRSPWVYGWFSVLVVVMTANFIMIYFAVDNNPGLVVEDYYDRGQSYEKNMVARMAKNPGWEMHISEPKKLRMNKPAIVEFRLATKEGGAVNPDSVTFYAYRPSSAKADFSLPMQAVGNGLYQAEVTFELKGIWDVLVSVEKEGEEYNESLRFGVMPAR
ncbi:FixH family protein [Pseudomonadota bacterium]